MTTSPADSGLESSRAPSVVAFDIGEVLIDETRVWQIWAELIGVSPLTFAATMGAAIVQGMDHEEAFGHLAPHVDWRLLSADHEARLGGLNPHDLYADVGSCLDALAEADVRVILAGNQPAIRRRQIEAFNLRCDLVVTSEELEAAKPDLQFFRRLMDRAGIDDPADVLYVGDRVDNDVIPAAMFGMRTCWLRRGPWGRLQDLPDDITIDVSLEGLGELPTILNAWRQEQPQ